MVETFKNEEFGLEAIITAGNDKMPFRAVLRDTDANETLSVLFGDYEQVIKAAKEFTK